MADDRDVCSVVVYFKDGTTAFITDVVKPVIEKEDDCLYVTTITELVICSGVDRFEYRNRS